MGIVAVLFGGMFASITTLIALFGVGVNWGTGVTIYFTTGLIVSAIILTLGMLASHKSAASNSSMLPQS